MIAVEGVEGDIQTSRNFGGVGDGVSVRIVGDIGNQGEVLLIYLHEFGAIELEIHEG